MTSEVLIMNQHAVVLAADSATTVSAWVNGKQEERYFNGANKLFQLSDYNPIALMIYNGASIMDVPWELVIRQYRAGLMRASFDTLEKYPENFFTYLRGAAHFFPDERKNESFITNAGSIMLAAVFAHKESIKGGKPEDPAAAYAEILTRLEERCRGKPPDPFTEASVDATAVEFRDRVVERLRTWGGGLDPIGYPLPADEAVVRLAVSAIKVALHEYEAVFSYSGLVFAGYGDEEYFPSYREYRCYGFIAGHLVTKLKNSSQIDTGKQSDIVPFATTSMINTFRVGISPDLTFRISETTEKTLRDFAQGILDDAGATCDAEKMEQRIRTAVDTHMAEWSDHAFKEHSAPLLRVVRVLPISEIAALARTLIELQSLKERVTKPSQSVGGPIEVAVVTKHDGFIWIDRKLYFKPELNTRFMARQHHLFK